MAADYMTDSVLFIVLLCFILVADRLDGSLQETSTRHTVSQCFITIGHVLTGVRLAYVSPLSGIK